VDDAKIIVTNSKDKNLKIVKNEIFVDINKWSKTKLLYWNFTKTHCLEFGTRSFNDNICVCYKNHRTFNATYTKFMELNRDNTLSWKCRTDWIISKLNSACFAIRSLISMLSQETFRMILLWNKDFQSPPNKHKDFQSPPSKHKKFNEWHGTFSSCPKKVF
jgi:hypothetical protein